MSLRRYSGMVLLGLIGSVTPGHTQGMPTIPLTRPTWVVMQPFTDVTAMRELRGGGILVADLSDQSVFIATGSGQSLQRLGRVGSGPNEYSTPTRLIPLPGDSTLLLDRDARRFLIIDPNGRFVATKPFPPVVNSGGEFMRGADRLGRLYFTVGFLSRSPSSPSTLAIYRWDRKSTKIDSVAAIMVPSPKPVERTIPGMGKAVVRLLMPFTPQDDWAVAPSGRIALVRALPYRVDWRELDGRITTGEAVRQASVPVTDADRKLREPQGPPFRLEYPATKPPFRRGMVVVDDRDHVYVRREGPAGASQATWDVFDPKGKYLVAMLLSVKKRIVAVTARFVYVVRTDENDLQWLEAYAR